VEVNQLPIRIILVETEGPSNIGAVARLLDNFGAQDWVLVRPQCEFGPEVHECRKYATGESWRRLENVRVVSTLAEAVDDCGFSVAFCGKVPGPRAPERVRVTQLARRLPEFSHQKPLALVFGNEARGLSFDDVRACPAFCEIETHPGLTSLNLSQAVAVVLYTLWSQSHSYPATELSAQLATEGEKARLMEHAEEMLRHLGFTEAGNPQRLLATLRSWFHRSAPRSNEIRALHAILQRVMR
jgi:TrmH family RNA methyltransferase